VAEESASVDADTVPADGHHVVQVAQAVGDPEPLRGRCRSSKGVPCQ
jgi:hypothetical protein